jgi:IPT/TIG domain
MGRGRARRVGARQTAVRGLVGLAIVVGTTMATVPLATVASASPGWSAPSLVDNTNPLRLRSVSCPTASFCMALNADGGSLVYNGTHWSTGPTVMSGDALSSVSCVSSTFCAALDFNGRGFIYKGHSWSAPTTLNAGAAMPSVSCATTTFCVAVDGDTGADGYIYNGSSWSSGVLIDTATTGGMASVSCPTASFCMAFDNNGNMVKTTDGGSVWSAYVSVDSIGSPQSVSCDTTTFCAMVDNDGNAFVYNGSIFTTFSGMDGSIRLASVSCATSSACVAVDVDGDALRYSSGSWSAPDFVDYVGSPTSVSCPASTSFCVAVDNDGGAVTSTDGGIAWGTPTTVDYGPTALSSVSCVSSIFCMAVDYQGHVVAYNGSSWSAPANIDGNTLTSVSCASANLCVAVDISGNEITFDGTSWSGLNDIDTEEFALTSVSCTTTPTTFCAAVDNGGNVMTSDNGTSWSSLSDIDGSNELEAVSCATADFCAAVDNNGNAFTWDGSGWTSDEDIDPNLELSSVSCTTTPTNFCTAVDDFGYALTYNGASWSAPYLFNSGGNGGDSVSCATDSFCMDVNNDGYALAWDGAGNSGTDWSSTSIDPGNSLDSDSCPSADFCMAVDDNGNALVYNGPNAAVTVSDVSPNTGPTTGSTPVTISGSGFTPGAIVDFSGVAATDIHVVNTTTITASSPAESAGTVDVIVTTTSGSSTPNPADQFTYAVVQSPSNTGCDPSCSETVSTPVDQTQVTVTGSSSSLTSNVSLVVNTDTLTCGGVYNYATPVATLSSTHFAVGATVTATETVANEPTKKGVKVCYAASSIATSGSFLSKCHGISPVAPCTKSLVEDDGSVVVTLLVPATDPRFWSGNGTLDLTSFSPTHGAPGKKITVKGKDLSQVTAVVIGGAQAKILSESSTKVSVDVPQGAVTGDITVTADSGDAVSTVPFTVS